MTITKRNPDSEFWQMVARGAREAEGYPDWKRGAMLEDKCRAAKADHERRVYGPTPEQELADLRRGIRAIIQRLQDDQYTDVCLALDISDDLEKLLARKQRGLGS